MSIAKTLLQNGHNKSLTSTCLLRKFNFVGSRSLISLYAKNDVLVGILSFPNSSKAPSRFSSLDSPNNRLYALCVEYWPFGSGFHTQISALCGWTTVCAVSPKNPSVVSTSLSNKGLLQIKFDSQPAFA